MLRPYRAAPLIAIVLFVIAFVGGLRMLDEAPARSAGGRIGTALAPVPAPTPAPQMVVVGLARAVDGDSLVIGPTRIRLFGVDAPELHQACAGSPCGREAHRGLASLVAGRELRCVGESVDRYQRLVATCYIHHEDVARVLVRNGFAMAYQRYSDRYAADELMARNERLGIWSRPGTQAPWLHRAEQRAKGG